MNAYRGNPSNPVIYYHVVPSKLRSNDFEGDQSVETRHQGHNIRINKYSNGVTHYEYSKYKNIRIIVKYNELKHSVYFYE